ncbi:MAG: cadherin domain-containing protein, partial [Rubripirellula sp.]
NRVIFVHDGTQTGSDRFDFSLSDGGEDSSTPATGTFNFTITNVNDAPVMASLEGTALAYSENDGAVAITAAITITDVDDTNIESAVIAISSNYTDGEDVLAFTNQNGIAGVWDSGSGTLTLTGSATLAQYEAALRSITYTNSSENPNTATRTVSFTVNDGDANSNTQTRDITITSVNDDPNNTGTLPADITVIEDVSSNVDLSAIDLSDVDAGSGSLLIKLNTSTGGNLTATLGTGITIGGNGSGALTLAGSLTDLNNYLNTASNVQYLHSTANRFGNDVDTIQVVVNDNGNTGFGGGTDQILGTVNIDIGEVNDRPVGIDSSVTAIEDTVYTFTASDFNFTDIESDDLLSVTFNSLPASGVLFYDTNLNNQFDAGEEITVGQQVFRANIDNNAIRFIAALDENGVAYTTFDFTVRDDGGFANGGQSFAAASNVMTINVTAVNDAPTDVAPNGFSIDENTDTSGGVSVGTLTTTDVDSGETFTYSIVGGADQAVFAISGDQLLLDDGVLDFETQSSYEVTVRSTDSGGLFFEETLTVDVNDLNEAPTVSLVNVVFTISEGTDTSAGVKIADIVIGDDALGTNNLSLSGADSGSFEIVGTELRLVAGASLNYEAKTTFDVTVEI